MGHRAGGRRQAVAGARAEAGTRLGAGAVQADDTLAAGLAQIRELARLRPLGHNFADGAASQFSSAGRYRWSPLACAWRSSLASVSMLVVGRSPPVNAQACRC